MSISRGCTVGIDSPVLFSGKAKKCPECKKKFDWLGEQWTYKTKHNGTMHYYCSWTCWRAEDKRKAARGISTLRGGNYAKW